MTLFSNQHLTVVSADGGGCQVQVPGNNVDLTADETRTLEIFVGFALVTHTKAAPIPSVAGIDLIFSDADVTVSPLVAPYTDPGLIVAVPLGNGTFYETFLTVDLAREMSNAIAAYTVVG